MGEVTLDNVARALETLYNDPINEHKYAAQQWLCKAQLSPSAWNLVWPIINDKSAPQERHFFAASVLHLNIKRRSSDLLSDEGQCTQIKDRLLNEVFFSKYAYYVQNKLMICLAAFILTTYETFWSTSIEELCKAAGNFKENPEQALLSLKVLVLLPEEYASTTATQTNSRRSGHRRFLKQHLEHVIQVVQDVLDNKETISSSIQMTACSCIVSWSQLEVALNEHNGLLLGLFNSILQSTDDLCDYYIDAFSHLVRHPSAKKYVNTFYEIILPKVLALQGVLSQNDPESYASLLVAVGEIHISSIVVCPPESTTNCHNLITQILQFMNYPGYYPVDEEISSLTFSFWYYMQDTVSEANNCPEWFIEVFRMLLHVYVSKLAFPINFSSYEQWTSEDKERHRCYRVDITDGIIYLQQYLGVFKVVTMLCDLYWAEFYNSQNSPWQRLEACIYALSACTEQSDPDEDEPVSLPALMDSLISLLQIGQPMLLESACDMIAAFSEWIAEHTISLQSVVPFLLECFPIVGFTAITSLREVISLCVLDMQPWVDIVLQQSLALEIKGCSQTVREHLAYVKGKVLSSLPNEQILCRLENILTPKIQRLETLSNQCDKASNQEISNIISILTQLCSSLDTQFCDEKGEVYSLRQNPNQPEPSLLLIQQFSPLLQNIIHTNHTSVVLASATCELYRRTLRTIGCQFAPILGLACELVLFIFSNVLVPDCINFTSQVLTVFGDSLPQRTMVSELIQRTVMQTRLAYDNESIVNYPDVVEAFFSFISLLFKHHRVHLQYLNLETLFLTVVQSSELPEHPTIKGTITLTTSMVNHSSELPKMHEIFVNGGGFKVAEIIIGALAGKIPKHLSEMWSETIMELKRRFGQYFALWFKQALNSESIKLISHLSDNDKIHFLSSLMNAGSKSDIRSICRHFSLTCHGDVPYDEGILSVK